MEDATPAVLPLPEMPASQIGTTTASHRNYKASVSNASGYLCHINLECNFNVPPQVLFDIFCHPDNAGAFRDIKKVGYRKVKSESPGFKVVEVEQCGELRVIWINRVFRTYLDVTEDARDPECLKTDFTLLKSDILSRFHGSWELRPLRDAAGNIVGCHAVLEQDVLPKGVPSFFAHLPVLGGLLRRVSLNAIQRLVEDILKIVKKYIAADGKKSLDEVLEQIARERGHRTRHEANRPEHLDSSSGGSNNGNGSSNNNNDSNVASFAIDSFSESEEEESSEGPESRVAKQQEQVKQEAVPQADLLVPAVAAVAAGASSSRGTSEAGSSGSCGGYRVSGDGVVTAVLVAAAAGGAAGIGSNKDKAAAMDDEAAAAATAEGSDMQQHHHHKRHHHHQDKQLMRQGEPQQLLGVLLDVTVHGHVHVDLIPNPDAVA